MTLVLLVSGFAVWAVYAVVCVRSTAQFAHVFSARKSMGVNLDGNVAFFINNLAFPAVFTLAAVAGILISEARRIAPAARLRTVRFLLVWFLCVFVIQLCSAAGGYDSRVFADTTRYVINLLPPLLALVAAGACDLYARLPGRALKSAAAAAAGAYLLFTVPLFSDFINSTSHFSRINRALLETVGKYQPGTTFVTNSDIAYNVLTLDAGRRAAYTQDPAAARALCRSENNCIFVFYRNGLMRELDALNLRCLDRILVESVSVLFVPVGEIEKVPPEFLKAPDPTPMTGAAPRP